MRACWPTLGRPCWPADTHAPASGAFDRLPASHPEAQGARACHLRHPSRMPYTTHLMRDPSRTDALNHTP